MKSISTRLIVLLAALLLAVSAMSCATTNQPSESATTIESEANTENSSSMPEESSNTSTVWQPQIPPESETTLELVKEAPLGEGGVPYYLMYEDDPTYATIMPAEDFLVDKNGVFYSYDSMMGLYNLQNGENVALDHDPSMYLVVPGQDEKFYAVTVDGEAVRFSPENGIEEIYSHITPSEEHPIHNSLFSYFTKEIFLQTNTGFYDMNGNRVTDLPFAVERITDTDSNLCIGGRTVAQGTGFLILLADREGLLVRQAATRYNAAGNSQYEYLIQKYDYQGNPIFSYKMAEICTKEYLPCDLPARDGKSCQWYQSRTLTIGENVFENELYSNFFFSADGSQYFVVISIDRVRIYRIRPGYSDVQFSEDLPEPIPSMSVQAANATADDIPTHTTLTRAEVLSRAEEMVNFKWTVTDAHKKTLADTQLPIQVKNANVGDVLTGIPYCWGGFNGLETCGSQLAFANAVQGNKMAGNVNCDTDGHQPNTIGLDCSGFVSSCYGFTSKLSTGGLNNNVGHAIDITQMQPMDFFVKSGEHTLLYASYDSKTKQYDVYECTVDTNQGKNIQGTVHRWISDSKVKNYSTRTAFYNETWSYNSTRHWNACSFCSEKHNYTTHDWISLSGSGNDIMAGVRFCQTCGYSTGMPIT